MTYTYDDIVTAKDILAGRVKKEDIIGKKGWFMDSMPCDMSLDGIEGESKHYCLGHVELNWECPFFADDGDGGTWTYFLPEKETYFLPEKEGSASITRFKIGDRVKYHGKFAERFANDFATVRSVDSGDRNLTYYIELKGNHYLWVNESDISPVCNEQSIATANPLFKVGDRVKIVKERNEFTEVYNPTIGKTHFNTSLASSIDLRNIFNISFKKCYHIACTTVFFLHKGITVTAHAPIIRFKTASGR